MAPEDRRAALIAATLPLMREHGTAVSTRQIAQAAGVAEGTIFGVFPDKNSLLRAALMSAFDPTATVEALAAIGTELELRDRLRAVVKLVRGRMIANAKLFAAPREFAADDREFAERMMEAQRRVQGAIVDLVDPDRDRLRRSPQAAAHLLLMVIMVSVHRGLFDDGGFEDMEDDEIVSVLLDGLLVRPSPTPTTESHT
ncbi:TetR/AcrR family transcriptional regulator [Spongiactinospora sp. TRM90649]|uniref:TetR/AcrR family transcriptional regulator n=1 Tax=Spongiactinospora sp. TRM90649 TaxID=3031114 RepID=UPI0023F8F700|nr:TetR/AcrR family transcriptional regulator [Spongiactinospora sp. TRM90649]MDF5756905.1 TetR/AcrR family transcriptional regulator [Spongiactinospora sp. TRM90649]